MKYLIDGGTGSLGQELTRQLLELPDTSVIRIFSRNENKQAEMQRKFKDERLRFLIGDIRDYDRVIRAMHGIDRVFHCAALKRVEKSHDVEEIIKTNIDGTVNVCNAADECRVEKLIFISSDKAAHPANIYGASKMVGEHKVLQMDAQSNTKFACTRYGNVIGSNGSIIPLWKEREHTGLIYITHSQMTRFWISLSQAASFVIRCMNGMDGGEIFLPKMRSFKIEDLARLVVPKCAIEYIGLRDPGEKLHEILVTPEEVSRTKDYGDKYIIGGNHFGGIPVEPDFEYRSDLVEPYTDKEMGELLCD